MNQTKKLVYTALFCALCFIATRVIQIPTPATGGYIHLGDAFVILSGMLLGKRYGALAAATGSALADLLSPYAYYAPVTFVIKFLAAYAAAIIYQKMADRQIKLSVSVLCGLCSTFIVDVGYFFYAYLTEGLAAVTSIPSNTLQGLSGMIISTLLLPILSQVPDMKNAFQLFHEKS